MRWWCLLAAAAAVGAAAAGARARGISGGVARGMARAVGRGQHAPVYTARWPTHFLKNLLFFFNAKSHYFPKWNEGFLRFSPILTIV